MLNSLPASNAGYADGAELDEFDPFEADSRIQLEIELGLCPGVIRD